MATQANTSLSVEEQALVAKAMCHDPTTAERFDVALANREEAFKRRDLHLKAIEMPPTYDDSQRRKKKPARRAKKPKSPTPSTSSVEDDRLVIDDHPSDDSALEDFVA